MPVTQVRTSITVVSHGQGELVRSLLADVERFCAADVELVLVLNLPEDEDFTRGVLPGRLRVLRSPAPRGFGANHNAAARVATGTRLFVVNPDIRFDADPLGPLLAELESDDVGVVGPRVVSPAGTEEETARPFPTALSLVRKALGARPAAQEGPGSDARDVDWVAGMFLGMRTEVFRRLGGFDESFFLYYEDVDLCARARSQGLRVRWVPGAVVCHDARRESHQNPRYLRWHLASASRFLLRRSTGRYR